MQVRLKDIAEIKSGYSFRDAIEYQESGNTLVLQAQNINDHIYLTETSNLTKINFNAKSGTNFLRNNDILIATRVYRNSNIKSAIYKSSVQNVIATSSCFIIRVKVNTEILPDFIAVYLNSFYGQTELKKSVLGSSVQMLTRPSLEDILLPIPEIQTQLKVIDFAQNTKLQIQLLERKMTLTKNTTDALIKNIIDKK